MDPITVDTPHGPGRIVAALPDEPRAVLLLGHGAGGGINAFDLEALAGGLPRHGVAVLRYEQPWRVAGRRVAARPAVLDEGWRPALAEVERRFAGVPLWVGGRSAGARVACRCFAAPQRGVVCLSFPLHPPGKPETSRIAELAGVRGPVLVVQGDRDPFGSPEEVRAAAVRAGGASRLQVVGLPGTHSLGPRTKVDQLSTVERVRRITEVVERFIGQ
jgi:predicted alpha/beta-hydrolase family hydrolase